MDTVEEVWHALNGLASGDRLTILRWLQVPDGGEKAAYAVAEAKAKYAPADLPFMTLEEFLEFEEHSEARYEYVDGVVFAMANPSVTHERICHRLIMALGTHLGRGPCQVFSGNMRILIQREASDVSYHPDVMVDCRRDGWDENLVRSPKLVVETLSPSTSLTDRREKFQNYKRIDSLEEYAIVAQVERKVTIHRRANDWRPHVYTGSDEAIEFCSIGLALPMNDLYDDILS